jgi:monoamine oxidase
VVRVQNVADGVQVTFQQPDGQHELRAERVVLAIPPGVLARLTIVPQLSAAKLRALRELSLESVTRIWIETDTRFWEARGEAGGADSDLPLGGLRDEGGRLPEKHGLLGIYASRDRSQLLSASSERERIDAALEHAERFHPGIRAHVTATASKCWDSDPFQRGAYAYFQPGQVTGLAPHLSAPEGRLHFAGDHTSQRPGFMHGALASAQRVLDEIGPQGE